MNTNRSSQSPSDVECPSRPATSAASWITPLALTRNLLLALLLLTPLFTLVPRIAAQTVPPLVNYQGRLSNPDGSPLPTADYTLTFNIYDAPTNGTLVWGPQVFDGAVAAGHGARIPVVQGYFNVMLGPVDTHATIRSLADAFNGTIGIPTLGESRYVEVTVSNRPPILPRQQILTTPFAFQTANSAKLAGYDWSVVFGTNNPQAVAIPWDRVGGRLTGTNMGPGGVGFSLPSGPSFSATTSFSNVGNMTLTLQTTGRPVLIFLVGTDGQNSFIRWRQTGGSGTPGTFRLLRNAQLNQDTTFGADAGSFELSMPPSSVSFFDVPPVGTHTYTLQFTVPSNSSLSVHQVRLAAFEL